MGPLITSCNYSSFHSNLSSTKDKTHSCGLENCCCTYCKLHEDVADSVQEPVGATYNTVPPAWMQRKTSLRLTEKDSLHWQRLTGTTQAPFITVIINDPQWRRSEKKNLSFKRIKKSKMTAKKSSINNKWAQLWDNTNKAKHQSTAQTCWINKCLIHFCSPMGLLIKLESWRSNN